jgi:hypothetical protein
VVGWGFFRTGDSPVVLYESLFIVATCILKKIENGAVAVGRSTRPCINIFTSRKRLLKAFTLVKK